MIFSITFQKNRLSCLKGPRIYTTLSEGNRPIFFVEQDRVRSRSLSSFWPELTMQQQAFSNFCCGDQKSEVDAQDSRFSTTKCSFRAIYTSWCLIAGKICHQNAGKTASKPACNRPAEMGKIATSTDSLLQNSWLQALLKEMWVVCKRSHLFFAYFSWANFSLSWWYISAISICNSGVHGTFWRAICLAEMQDDPCNLVARE